MACLGFRAFDPSHSLLSMMYGLLRFFEAPAILWAFVIRWLLRNLLLPHAHRVNTPFASGKPTCLGFRAFDPYIISSILPAG